MWRAACSMSSQAGLVMGRGRFPRPGRAPVRGLRLSEWLVAAGPEGSPVLCVLGASEEVGKASGLRERFKTSQVVCDCVSGARWGVCVHGMGDGGTCIPWGVAAMLSVFLTQLSPDIIFHCDCWMEISWMLVYGERNLKSQSTIPKGDLLPVFFGGGREGGSASKK